MRDNDETAQFEGMEDDIPDGDRSRLRINATLKDCNLKAKKEGEVYKIVLEVDKDHVDMDARLALTELTGQDVSLYMCSLDYERFQNAKARGINEGRKRAEATARQEASDVAGDPVTLKSAKILTIGDFRDSDGNIFTVVENDGKYVIDAIGDSDNLAELDLPTDEHEFEDDARKALKEWCANRGYSEVCPQGYGMVYNSAAGGLIIRVGESELHEADGVAGAFQAFACRADGSDAERIDGHVASQQGCCPAVKDIADAQTDLDEWASKHDRNLYGFIKLADVEANCDANFVPVADDEPAMLAMVYQDGEGNRYWIERITDADSQTEVYRVLKGSTDKTVGFYDGLTIGHEEDLGFVQGELKSHAEANGWTPKPVTELLTEADAEESAEPAEEPAPEPVEEPAPEQPAEEPVEQPAEEPAPWEDEPATEPVAESPAEEPATEQVEEATQEAADQASESEAAEHAPLYDDIAANWGTDKQIGYLIKAGDKTRYKIDDVNFDERSVKLFGYGTIFADELQEKYRVAPPEEPKPEPVKEPEPEPAPEPTPEPEPEPVEATVDPFEDGGSIADLHDFLMKNKGRKDLKLRTKATDGQSAGSSKSILAVVEEGVRMVGVGLVTKDEINEKWEVAK